MNGTLLVSTVNQWLLWTLNDICCSVNFMYSQMLQTFRVLLCVNIAVLQKPLFIVLGLELKIISIFI